MTILLIHIFSRMNSLSRVAILAQKTDAIVSSLFPENVRDRLFKKKEVKSNKKKSKRKKNTFEPAKAKMRNFLCDESQCSDEPHGLMDPDLDDRPIADLFPETTVMFADIAG